MGFLYYFTPIYLKKIGTLQSNIGRIIMCYCIAIVFAGPLFSKFMENEDSRKYYILAGGIIAGISLMTFNFFNDFYSVLFIVSMIGIAHSLSVSSQASLVSETKVVREIGVGTGMGVFRFWERTGNVAGPIVMGSLISSFGFKDAVVYTGMVSVITSMAYMIFILTGKKGKE